MTDYELMCFAVCAIIFAVPLIACIAAPIVCVKSARGDYNTTYSPKGQGRAFYGHPGGARPVTRGFTPQVQQNPPIAPAVAHARYQRAASQYMLDQEIEEWLKANPNPVIPSTVMI